VTLCSKKIKPIHVTLSSFFDLRDAARELELKEAGIWAVWLMLLLLQESSYLHRVHEKTAPPVYVAITLANNVGF